MSSSALLEVPFHSAGGGALLLPCFLVIPESGFMVRVERDLEEEVEELNVDGVRQMRIEGVRRELRCEESLRALSLSTHHNRHR